MVADLSKERREFALKLGVDYSLNPSDENFAEEMKNHNWRDKMKLTIQKLKKLFHGTVLFVKKRLFETKKIYCFTDGIF